MDVVELHIIVVVERDAVELEEGVCGFVARGCQPAVQGNARGIHRPGAANVHAFALLDVPKVDGINATALVGDDGWFHVADQGPLRGAEEGVGLDVGGTSSGTQPSVLVLDQEFPDE